MLNVVVRIPLFLGILKPDFDMAAYSKRVFDLVAQSNLKSIDQDKFPSYYAEYLPFINFYYTKDRYVNDTSNGSVWFDRTEKVRKVFNLHLLYYSILLVFFSFFPIPAFSKTQSTKH